jgi:hypothetical protein
LRSLARQLSARLERTLNRREQQRAAARYRAAIGYDMPRDERAAWLREAASGAPMKKHRLPHLAR